MIVRNPNPIGNFQESRISNQEAMIGFSQIQQKKSSFMLSHLGANQNSFSQLMSK